MRSALHDDGLFERVFAAASEADRAAGVELYERRGRLVSLLLSGEEADWSVKKGAVWWLTTREREGRAQVVLRAA
ncbi:MAG: histidine phosphatase family protein, partial [Acidobacteria bacterium]